jgi:hypothetical protein
LYELDFAVSWPDKGDAIIDRIASLRVLLQRGDPQAVHQPIGGWDNENLRGDVPFEGPLLFTASGTAKKLRLEGKDEDLTAIPASIELAPSSDNWAVESQSFLGMPALRLVSGVVKARIKSGNVAKLLQLDLQKKTILGGLEIQAKDYFDLTFTPDGIEFEAGVPSPTPDLTTGEFKSVLVVLRLGWDKASGSGDSYQLELVDGVVQPNRPNTLVGIETGIAGAFGILRQHNARLVLDFNTRLKVPPLSWEVARNGKKAPLKFVKVARLDGAAVRARLLTPDVAEFSPRIVRMQGDASSFLIEADTGTGAPTPSLSSIWTRDKNNVWTEKAADLVEQTFTIDGDALGNRLLPIYSASRALPPDAAGAGYAFVPIDRGWLQLPFPASVPERSISSTDTVLTGEVRIPLALVGQQSALRDIEVQGASRVVATARWTIAPGSVTLTSVAVSFDEAFGEVTGLLFAAETSPTAAEILPNLQAGPIATRDLPLAFGSAQKSQGIFWSGLIAVASGQEPVLSLNLPGDSVPPNRTIAWRRVEKLPAIPNFCMTRTAASLGLPSQSQGLIPATLAEGKTKLDFLPGAYLPKLLADGEVFKDWWAWRAGEGKEPPEWGNKGIALVLPTLPGIELTPKASLHDLYGALRFDVPILDELFASAELPAGNSPKRSSLPPTSLDLKRLSGAWQANFAKLSLARTQSAYATPAVPVDKPAAQVDVTGLIEPYLWKANFGIQVTSGVDGLPTGGYSLDGTPFAAEDATVGLPEARFKLSRTGLTRATDGTIRTENLAAALFPIGGGMQQDSRHFAVANQPTGTDFYQRSAQSKVGDRKLVSAINPIPLTAFGVSIQFWFRDLSMEEGGGVLTFNGAENYVEGVPGSEGQAFDAERLPESLHEWRFFQDQDQRFDIQMVPFRFRPLRLWNLELEPKKGTPVKKISVLGRISLGIAPPWHGNPSAGPFAPDDSYEHGNLVLLEIEGTSFKLTRQTATPNSTTGLLDVAASSEEVRFFFDATVAGSKDSVLPLVLGCKIGDDNSWTLAARIFGGNCRLTGGVATFLNNLLTIAFTSPPPVGAVFLLKAATLTVPLGTGKTPKLELVPVLRIGAQIDLGKGSDSPAVFRWSSATAASSWFGLQLDNTDVASEIDHASGRISLTVESDLAHNEDFIAGIIFAPGGIKVRGVVEALVTPLGDALAAWPGFQLDALHISMEGKAPEDGAILLHTLSYPAPPNNPQAHRLMLTADLKRTSTIKWPGIDIDGTYNEKHPGSSEINIVQDKSLIHRFQVHLKEHSFPLQNLMESETGALVLGTSSWTVNAIVGHCLKVENEDKALEWFTLDQVSFTSLRVLVEEAKNSDKEFAMAPFHRKGKYRGHLVGPSMADGGIANITLADSGFRDEYLLREIIGKVKPDAAQVIIRGGCAISFPHHVATMHYGAAGGSTPLPLPLDDLPQAANRRIVWRVANFDASAGADANLDRSLPVVLSPEVTEEDITRRLTSATAAVIEQVFFEPVAGAGMPDVKAVPYFLRTLIVLRKVWDVVWQTNTTRKVLVTAESMITGSAVGQVTRVMVGARRDLPPTQILPQMTVLSKIDGVRSVAVRVIDVSDPTQARARLLSLAAAAVASPLSVIVDSFDSENRRKWSKVDVPRGRQDFGFRSPRRFLNGEVIPASGALGWPSAVKLKIAAQLVATIGEEGPVVSAKAGLSGRTATLGWPAFAPDDNSDKLDALYHDFSAPVIFQRDDAPQQFRGPAARHLSPVVSRRRAPRGDATTKVLNNLTSAGNKAAPITAPQIETGMFGLRPGVFHVVASSMTVPGDEYGFDPAFARFGRPASSGPAVVHQLRAPRGTSLPVDPDLRTRRRTYLSDADALTSSDTDLAKGQDKFALFRAFEGSAAVFRSEDESPQRSWRFVLRPKPSQSLGPAWDGKVVLELNCAGPSPEEADVLRKLQEIGLLPLGDNPTPPRANTSARRDVPKIDLLVGDAVFPFDKLEWTPPTRLPLGFAISLIGSLNAARDALKNATGDTPVRLLIQLRTNDPGAPPTGLQTVKLPNATVDQLTPGPPLNLVLPLQIASPDRPVLPLSTTTIVFGDPSYDRQLGSSTQSAQLRDPTNQSYLLALDRSQYDVEGTVYFAFGTIDPNSTVKRFGPAGGVARVQFRIQRGSPVDGPPTPSTPVSIDGVKSVADKMMQSVQLGSAYAVPLRAFRLNGEPIPWASGDQLIVTALVPDLSRSVEVRARIVAHPQIAPSPSVYSVVGQGPGKSFADVPLHAAGPIPQLIEFPNLLDDLAAGHVRRKGLFVWSWTEVKQRRLITLIKMDRSGAAQIPVTVNDFKTPERFQNH